MFLKALYFNYSICNKWNYYIIANIFFIFYQIFCLPRHLQLIYRPWRLNKYLIMSCHLHTNLSMYPYLIFVTELPRKCDHVISQRESPDWLVLMAYYKIGDNPGTDPILGYILTATLLPPPPLPLYVTTI